jgi:hypothetical protein
MPLSFPSRFSPNGATNFSGAPEFARNYRAAGDRRLKLLCGTSYCMISAKRTQAIAERQGLDVIVSGDAMPLS